MDYEPFVYDYDHFPGARGAARFIGVDPHVAVKTIVMVTSEGNGAVVVLMHGDREVSTKKLARVLGVKGAEPADQVQARHWTGYRFGGTSPLGMRTPLPVLAEAGIADLDRVYVNAGSRGFVIGMAVSDLLSVVDARLADLSA